MAAVVLSGSSDSGDVAPAPAACVEAWNSDPAAVEFGRHNALSHQYVAVEVGYLPREGGDGLAGDPAEGECTVVFAARELDPEPMAAGQIMLGRRWVPLSRLLGQAELAALQSAALAGANATVTAEGLLAEP